ncbi:MAG: hypothetical protein H6Q25_1368 [Bacteroidetes bacterium]|nr:hypothetical protein [Bacteroidota bacterium]
MNCSKCKTEIPDGSKFCNHCGAKIEDEGKTCPNPECFRTKLPFEALFCPDCGKKLGSGLASFTETVNGVSFDMIAIEGGEFFMGSPPNEKGRSFNEFQHKVTLSDYFLSETLVTQALWEVVMGKNRSYFKGDNNPVDSISWKYSQIFLERLKQLTERSYQLPTEAQWEYAAKGGSFSKGFLYSGSNNLDAVGWYIDNCNNKTNDVRSMLPNELGLFDMSGNVWEWCQDYYGEYDRNFPTNPQGPNFGTLRVFRGGCWSRNPRDCRNSNRCAGDPGLSRSTHGFRLALNLNQ